ncbi:Sugar transporter ERD6-like 6 [Capsicum chinense]|nr:Sugar transporter ERD6-like 6 [Capsicum chinense]
MRFHGFNTWPAFWGLRVEQLPTTYLGMPLGSKHRDLDIWDGINSILDSLPTYVMSLFPIPGGPKDGNGAVRVLSYAVRVLSYAVRGGLKNVALPSTDTWTIFHPRISSVAKMGLTEDFETSLQVLRGFDADISVEVNEIKRAVASTSRKSTIRFADLKQRRYWLPLMIGIGLLVLQQLGGTNGVIFYSSNIFLSAGISSSNAATFGVGAIQVVATAVSTWLVDKTGRRLLLIVSSSGMAVSLLIVAVAFFLKSFVDEDSTLYGALGIISVVGVVLMIVAFSLGMGPIPWLIMSEILPVKIKGLAGSVATLANWFFSWVVTATAPLLLAWSSGGTFTLYTLMCAFTVAFVTIWVPETKGKTLEEIQFSFR